MSATATRENTRERWDALRMGDHMPSPAPLYHHRVGAILTILHFCLRQTPGPAAVLDIGAGGGAIGRYGRLSQQQGTFPPFTYHATEQSAPMREVIRQSVPDASVAVWSFGERSLADTLGDSEDSFLREYPTVLLSHVLEHVEDYYGLLDEAWSFVKPGGFLVVAVPRNSEHRSHFTTWDWTRLIAVLQQYGGPGAPVACWDFTDQEIYGLFCAVPKPTLSGQLDPSRNGAIVAQIHADPRVQGNFPTAIDTAAQTIMNGKAPD